MNENYHDFHDRKRTRTFIYIKGKKNAKRFYIQKAITFQKATQFSLRFYTQKAIHLMLHNLS